MPWFKFYVARIKGFVNIFALLTGLLQNAIILFAIIDEEWKKWG